MLKKLVVLFALVATSALAADRADEVRQTETAFAKAFADRDAAKFFSFVADDATFMGQKKTMSGKAEVVKVWSEYLKAAQAPFSWKPERVAVNASGDLGLSTGPVYDGSGKHIGDFISTWTRQADGSWKVVFDGPGSHVCEAK
jgi:ketosteroid isomerase-like protein